MVDHKDNALEDHYDAEDIQVLKGLEGVNFL